MVEKTRFVCVLLGEDSGHYCEGTIKGTAEEVTAALQKFLPRTAWELSLVGLGNQQQDDFVHAPVRVVVDLKRTRCTPVLQASKEETSLAMAPAPQTTVAQMMNIKSRRCFDVMAVIHSVSDTRNPVGHPPVADVHLVDGTLTSKSKTAEAVVAVWGGRQHRTMSVAHRATAVVSQHSGQVQWRFGTEPVARSLGGS